MILLKRRRVEGSRDIPQRPYIEYSQDIQSSCRSRSKHFLPLSTVAEDRRQTTLVPSGNCNSMSRRSHDHHYKQQTIDRGFESNNTSNRYNSVSPDASRMTTMLFRCPWLECTHRCSTYEDAEFHMTGHASSQRPVKRKDVHLAWGPFSGEKPRLPPPEPGKRVILRFAPPYADCDCD